MHVRSSMIVYFAMLKTVLVHVSKIDFSPKLFTVELSYTHYFVAYIMLYYCAKLHENLSTRHSGTRGTIFRIIVHVMSWLVNFDVS